MNICRPITFYNNFVPPSERIQKWEYEALGYYDGIDIGENIITNDGNFNFTTLWENLENKVKDFCGCYNARTLFAFRFEDENIQVRDAKFWKKEQIKNNKIVYYPFLFIMMVRLNLSAGNVKTFREEIEKYQSSENLLIITYLSLDNNDVIIAIKSKRYEDGAKFIFQLHYNPKIANKNEQMAIYDSFSVGGVKKEYVNSYDWKLFSREQNIERICIRVIEKAPGTIQMMKNAMNYCFGDKVKTYPVLGCEDEVFLLENIPADKFWKLYKDDEGILCNSNKGIYQNSVFGMTTLILQPVENREELIKICGKKKKKVKKMCEELRKEFLAIGLNEKIREKMYLKSILQIINSLQKYENMDYVDYTYIVLYAPMNMLLELVKMEKENQKNEIEEQEEILHGISGFFYAINLLAQNSTRLERQFIQSVDLNARIYEAPVQLNAFYFAYFSLLRDILNKGVGEEYNYEFMICPGMAEYLNVQRVLPRASRKKRLLLVEIPEHQIYNVRNQLMVMAHEAAHFVGRDIRCREYRHELIVQVIAKSVSTFLILDEEMHPYCAAKSIKKFEEKYLKALQNELEAFYHELEEKNIRIGEDRFHTEYMKDDLRIYAQSALLGKEDLWDEIGKEALERFARSMELENLDIADKLLKLRQFKTEFLENKKTFLIRMTIPETTLSDECCINNIVDSSIHLMKETFADIISVLLLQLSPEEYIESLFYSSEQVQELQGHIRLIEWRIALVIRVMMYNIRGGFTVKWKLESLKHMVELQVNEKQKKLAKRIVYLLENYLLTSKTIFEIYNEDNQREMQVFGERRGTNRLYNKEVTNMFIDYLKQCCDKFYKKETEGIYGGELKELRKIWENLKKIENVEKYIIDIRSFIEKYEQKWILKLGDFDE